MIEERVFKVVAEQVGDDISNIEQSHNLINHYQFDSLDYLELIMSIEEMTGVDINENDINWNYVSDIVDYVSSLSGENG